MDKRKTKRNNILSKMFICASKDLIWIDVTEPTVQISSKSWIANLKLKDAGLNHLCVDRQPTINNFIIINHNKKAELRKWYLTFISLCWKVACSHVKNYKNFVNYWTEAKILKPK